jgi:hypothetical protein
MRFFLTDLAQPRQSIWSITGGIVVLLDLETLLTFGLVNSNTLS